MLEGRGRPTAVGATSLTYPLLKLNEIVKFLSDLRIHLTIEELMKPTSTRMTAVYNEFLEIIMGTSQEQLSVSECNDSNFSAYPELHNESSKLILHYMQLRKFMVDIGVYDFSLVDVIKPESARVVRCLSAIINFTKFREQRISALEVITERAEELVSQKAAQQKKSKELVAHLNKLRLQREEQEKESAEIKKKNETLTAGINEMRRTQASLSSDVEKLTADSESLDNKLSHVKSHIDNLSSACNKLAQSIVKSPERLKNTLNELEASLRSETSRFLTVEQRLYNLQNTSNAVNEQIKIFSHCISVVNACLDEYNESKRLDSELSALLTSISETEAIEKRLEFEFGEAKRKYNHAELKIHRLDEHRAARDKIGEKTILALKAEADTLDNELTEAYKNARKSEADINEKKDKLLEQEKTEFEIKASLDLMLDNFINSFKKYAEGISAEIDHPTKNQM